MNVLEHKCEIHIAQSTDVFIHTLSLLEDFTEESPEFELFVSLWFSYLKMMLNYVKNIKSLSALTEDNLKRILSLVIKDRQILREDAKGELWQKSWEVINSFYPNLKSAY